MYINNYINYLKSESKSPCTITAYERDLTQMMGFINKPEEDITLVDLENWKGSMTCASASKARKIASAKGYFKYLRKHNIIATEPTTDLTRGKIKSKQKTPLKGEELRAMIAACDNSRDKALIMLLAATGLRVSEAINLTYDKYINRKDDVIAITGKGDKTRSIGLAPEVCQYIDEYISTGRKNNCDSLFTSRTGNHLHPNNVEDMVKKTAQKAGIANYNEISPHWLRCTFATMQIENGTPLPVVQKQLGHSSITTTMFYVKIADKTATNAMCNINF